MGYTSKTFITLIAAALMSQGISGSAQAQEKIRGGKGYFMLGGNIVDIDALNTSLQSQGYPEFSDEFLSLGGGGHFIINRFIIGGEGHGFIERDERATLDDGNFETSLTAGYGFFDLGYRLFSTGGFTLYPMVGIGGGAMNLKITESAAPSFDDVLTNPQRGTDLIIGGLLLQASLGADWTLNLRGHDVKGKRGGLLIGLRAGYIFAPIEGDWRFHETEISGGPDFGLTGPYIRLLIGGGGIRTE